MPATYSRDAIQFEASFAAHFFNLSPEEALTHEAVYFYQLQNKDRYNHNFDSSETGMWLRQYLPESNEERQRVLSKMDELQKQIHKDDASRNHYNYAYAQFAKSYNLL